MSRDKSIGDLAIFYGNKPNTGQYDNGIWMDVLDIPYIERIEEASLYKTIIRTLWLDATGWNKEIRKRWPSKRIIGLSDHPLSAHISRLSPDRQLAYVDDLQYLDGIMALTEEERQWYSVAVPSKPVIKVGLPFPFDAYEREYGKYRGQEKEFIGLGVGATDNDRNFISNALIFKRLQLEFPDIKGVFLSIPDKLLTSTAYLADRISNIWIHQRTEMGEFYEMLSRCKFVLNLADRNTPGRIQGEAAFFGVPVIGSNRLELQNELWPTLSVTPFQLETAVQLGRELLLGDSLTPFDITEYAKTMLQQYSYEYSRKRFQELVERIEGSV